MSVEPFAYLSKPREAGQAGDSVAAAKPTCHQVSLK